MAHSVEMPALGESVTEGTVTRWLKQEGDTVAVDEPLLEVSTDKVDTEIPSPTAGVLQKIVVPEDETVEVGAQLALIGDEGEAPADDSGGSNGGAQLVEESGEAEAAPESDIEPGPDTKPEPDVDPEPRTEPAPAPAASSDSGGGSHSGGGSGSGDGAGTPVTMPALGESVTEGTVTRWLKQVGESVEVDEPLLEVSTDKVDTEIPSPVAGTVLEITVAEDETVEVGGQLALVGSGSASGGESSADTAPEQVESRAETAEEQAQPEQAHPEPQPEPKPAAKPEPEPARASSDGAQSATPYVTPLVRKLASEYGVNLSAVEGTGVGGRIRKQDVLAAVEKPEPAATPTEAPAQKAAPKQPSTAAVSARDRTEKMSRLRTLIAKRMVESLRTSAQLTTVTEVDVTRIARLRDRAKRDFETRERVRLSFLPFFAKATVEALKCHPNVNASIDEEAGEITYHGAEHLGIAVDTERGLLVPVIHDAGDLNIAGLARRIADVAERTRANKITPDELVGGTFTLTNTGSRGALFDTPIINQPQVGILGTGSVVKRPVVMSGEDGETLAVRSMMYLALSYDHRLVDGADAARFLSTVKERLEAGAFEDDLAL